jgi:hypothetical protein
MNKLLKRIKINQRNVALITKGVSHYVTNKIDIHVSQIYYLVSHTCLDLLSHLQDYYLMLHEGHKIYYIFLITINERKMHMIYLDVFRQTPPYVN